MYFSVPRRSQIPGGSRRRPVGSTQRGEADPGFGRQRGGEVKEPKEVRQQGEDDLRRGGQKGAEAQRRAR